MAGATIVRELECKLTQKEWRDRAKRLAQSPVERGELEEEAKRAQAGYKTRIGEMEAEEKKLARSVREGVEFRDVHCHEEERLEQNAIVLIRDDTGDVIEERPMTYEERQGELGLDDEPQEDDDEPQEDDAVHDDDDDEPPED